jgi:hypothetical protein
MGVIYISTHTTHDVALFVIILVIDPLQSFPKSASRCDELVTHDFSLALKVALAKPRGPAPRQSQAPAHESKRK